MIEIPPSEEIDIPSRPLYLEDELLRVWGRKADIIYIRDSELRGYISIEALLSSLDLTRTMR